MHAFRIIAFLFAGSSLFAAGPSFLPDTKEGPSIFQTHLIHNPEAHNDLVSFFETPGLSLRTKVTVAFQPANLEFLSEIYAPHVAHRLLTYGFMLLEQADNALPLWEMFSAHFPEETHEVMYQEALLGKGVFSARSDREIFLFLQNAVTRCGVGAEIAQRKLNIAADEGLLTFIPNDNETEDENIATRQKYLKRIVKNGGTGAEHAQRTLNQCAYDGWLGFPDEGDCGYLQKIVRRGELGAEHAQCLLNNAALNGRLGFDRKDIGYLQEIHESGSLGSYHAGQILITLSYQEHSFEDMDAEIDPRYAVDVMPMEEINNQDTTSPWQRFFMETLTTLPRG